MLEDFCLALKSAFDRESKINHMLFQSEKNQLFLRELDKISANDKVNEHVKMTQASILFEGFYRQIDKSEFKRILTDVKIKRWEKHFGTPTLTFLLTYKQEINQTEHFFQNLDLEDSFPWLINIRSDFVIDHDNDIICSSNCIFQIDTPPSREITGVFTKTHNPLGGYTTTPCDPISQQFLEHVVVIGQSGGKVLEIGAAFGAATLEALAKDATVFCNDINPDNLAVVRQRFLKITGENSETTTGDSSKLILIPGEFPNELAGLPEKSFDAILICRVLHFFTGVKIEESLTHISKLLVDGGKIYIVCETPYLKNWERFIPEFNRRIASQVEWPGEITTPTDYESSGRAASLPPFVHWITKEVLERSLLRAGFAIEHASYINRAGQFPDDLLLPEYSKESVGAIGLKCEKNHV